MSNHAYEYYKGLPAWGKAVVIIGGGLVVFFVGKSVWDTVGKALSPPPANLQQAKDAVTTLNTLAGKGITPTNTDAQFQGYVSIIVQGLSGCFASSDNIKTVFSNMNNDADVYKLIATFGTQDIPECLWGTFNGSLSDCLSNRLYSYQIDPLNSILASKGISVTF